MSHLRPSIQCETKKAYTHVNAQTLIRLAQNMSNPLLVESHSQNKGFPASFLCQLYVVLSKTISSITNWNELWSFHSFRTNLFYLSQGSEHLKHNHHLFGVSFLLWHCSKMIQVHFMKYVIINGPQMTKRIKARSFDRTSKLVNRSNMNSFLVEQWSFVLKIVVVFVVVTGTSKFVTFFDDRVL